MRYHTDELEGSIGVYSLFHYVCREAHIPSPEIYFKLAEIRTAQQNSVVKIFSCMNSQYEAKNVNT